ncbi:MAG: hypothetical protein JST48_13540 [Bacteroidetes bacterium]|nr:hypothetical protein [Bacteroidota bacterium]
MALIETGAQAPVFIFALFFYWDTILFRAVRRKFHSLPIGWININIGKVSGSFQWMLFGNPRKIQQK